MNPSEAPGEIPSDEVLRSEADAAPSPPVVPAQAVSAERIWSVDAYRGLVMLLMMAEALDLPRVASRFPGNPWWQFLGHHQTHAPWLGCSLHDLIQPSFTFLVGVALPYSLARRSAEGQPQWLRTAHAFWRALVLVLLGVFLRSIHHQQTAWTFEDTLTQIGLGYGFLYLLAHRSVRVQWIALAVILFGYWLAFALTPLPGADFDWVRACATSVEQGRLSGFAMHWSKNANLASRFDEWFLNLFPQEKPYTPNGGGYVTLSFIPTLGTMILGLLAGQTLRSSRSFWGKILWLVVAACAGAAAGWALDALGWCPVVKRIWTPSWVLFSGGWCFAFLAFAYLVLDVIRFRFWAGWLVVVGRNSIAAYLIAHLFADFIRKAWPRHLGPQFFQLAGDAYEPLLLGAAVLFTEWLILWWMSRRKIYLRI